MNVTHPNCTYGDLFVSKMTRMSKKSLVVEGGHSSQIVCLRRHIYPAVNPEGEELQKSYVQICVGNETDAG
jgi:hypothetical protein